MNSKEQAFYTSDIEPDRYLRVNSCGFQRNTCFRLLRENGRSDYHILLITEGSVEAEYDNKMYTLKNGNILIYEPGEKQRYSWEKDSAYLWLHFNGTSIHEIINDFGLKGGVYTTDYNKEVFEGFSRLIDRFSQPALNRLVNGTLLTLLANISYSVSRINKTKSSDAISEILTYINMNYNKKITINELVLKSGYSRSRFFKLFSSAVNTTPIAYQQDIRLNNACELLSTADYSISEIAFCCGFDDPLYFSRVFKNRYGVSPGKYRKLIR